MVAQSRVDGETGREAWLGAADEVGRALRAALALDELFDALYEQTQRVFRSRSFFVAIYEEDEDEWFVVFDMQRGQRAPRVRFRGMTGYTGYIIRTRQPLLLHTAQEGIDFRRNHGIELLGEEAKCWLGVPLISGDRVTGVMAVQSYEQENLYGEGDLTLLQTMAHQAALALQRARLLSEERAASRLLADRVRALDCLNDIGRMMDESPSVRELLEWVTERVPVAMRYADDCLAAVGLEVRVYGRAEAMDLPRQIVQELRVGDAWMGRLYVAYTQDHAFLEEERAFLSEVARRIAGYVERQRLLAEIQDRVRREQILREITARLSVTVDPHTIVRAAVRELGTALGRRAFVRLGSEEQLSRDHGPPGAAAAQDTDATPTEGGECDA